MLPNLWWCMHNGFHRKWLVCTILCALLGKAVGRQIRFDSEKLEMFQALKLSIMIKFWVCVLVWLKKWHQTIKLALAGVVVCCRLHFTSVHTYEEIGSTFPDNSGLVHLVRQVKKVRSSLVLNGLWPSKSALIQRPFEVRLYFSS